MTKEKAPTSAWSERVRRRERERAQQRAGGRPTGSERCSAGAAKRSLVLL